MRDLPPPLFCRPRKSPKFINDSKQPSISCITNFGTSDNRSILCESRRQSNAAAQRAGDLEAAFVNNSSNSVVVIGNQYKESSPFTSKQRKFDKLDNTPLYINDDSQSVNENLINPTDDGDSIKPLAKVRPQRILKSINSSAEDIGENISKIIEVSSTKFLPSLQIIVHILYDRLLQATTTKIKIHCLGRVIRWILSLKTN